MRVIILAAGLGRRMSPLSDHRHKTLLPVADTTILRKILDALQTYGLHDVCIVTGYRAAEIRAFVGTEFPSLNVTYVHNDVYATTNNVHSMALALEHSTIDGDIILIESDLIFDSRVLGQLIESPHTNCALVDRYRPGMDGTVVSVAPDDSIVQVFPSYLQSGEFTFSNKFKTLNMYKFGAEFSRTSFRQLLTFYAGAIDGNCYYELLLGVLIFMRATTVHAVMVDYPWAEVDDPNDLASAEFTFNEDARRGLVERAWGGYWSLLHVDFSFLRNMYFPTPAVLAELRANLENLLHNYGSGQHVLNRKLSYVARCDERNVITLNGASQAFPSLHRLLADKGVLRPAPTFGEYERMFPLADTYRDDCAIDWEEVAARSNRADVLIVVNPNNPTGTVVPTELIATLAASRPELTVLVDESFIEFSDESSVIPLVEAAGLENVIVLKSLSKVLGAPGLRLGFLHSLDDRFRRRVLEDVPVWNVNSVAENFLELILKHRQAVEESFAHTKADRCAFGLALEACSIVDRVYPSGANFLLVRLALDLAATDALVTRLMNVDLVHLKDVSGKFGDGRAYLRIAVRTPDENLRLCHLLEAAVAHV